MRPLSVLQYTDSDCWAGTERHIVELSAALRAECVTPVIVCPQDSPLWQAALREELDCIPLPKRVLLDRAAIRELAALLRARRADLIHAHNGRTWLLAALAARRARCGRCVATQHFVMPAHTELTGMKRWVYDRAHRWVERRTPRIIAVSGAVHIAAQARDSIPAEKLRLVRHGIRPPVIAPETARAALQEAGFGDRRPTVVVTCRLAPEKGLPYLIEAASHVRKTIPDARFLVIGRGAQEAELRRMIADRALEETVYLLGFRDNADHFAAAADLAVLPAPAETFGIAILEAMALARPIIATDNAGPREIIENGVTGVLIPPADPDSLAAAIIRLLCDRETANRLGEAARCRVLTEFTVERMASATASVYREALES